MTIKRMHKRNFLSPHVLILITLVFGFTSSSQVLAEQKTEQKSPAVESPEEMKPQIGSMDDKVAVDVNTFEFSSAERKIWLDDHLQNVKKPTRLYYEFVKDGSFEEGFTDSVYLDVVNINDDGSKNTTLDFFSQDRRQKTSSDNLNNIRGNPVIGIYMQGDVMDMNRLTEGSWRYFQRRIKFAISDEAEIEPVSFEFNGSNIEGEKITITPYVKDPRRNQFRDFADKRYEFIFSKHIPGSLYQINTVIPDNSGSGKMPLIKETLTLRNAEVRI
jgi:hypothetical protein